MLHFVISYFVFENTVKVYEGKRLSFGSTSTDPPDINFEECYATLARSLIDQISFKLSKCEVTKW